MVSTFRHSVCKFKAINNWRKSNKLRLSFLDAQQCNLVDRKNTVVETGAFIFSVKEGQRGTFLLSNTTHKRVE